MFNPRIGTFLIACSVLLWAFSLATTVEYDANAIIINGERRIIISGTIHYPRRTSQMWPDIIKKAKDGGLNAIETYVFWDLHEPARRQYDFSENLDFIKFLKNVQEAGLYVVLRIGSYEMETFTTKIVSMCKEAGLFAPQGGPIILAQIENEYGDVMSHYGEAGNTHIKWCAQMALAQNIGVPWIMCKQSNASAPMINTCNGYYCDNFEPNNPKSPKMFIENWVGWFQKWGERRPHRTAEDVAFSVARFFQRGGVFQNYYMYNGGTNFRRTTGGPYIITAYEYDAPLDEYGNLNQPKWGHLRELHAALKIGEKILTNGTVTGKQYGNLVYLNTYTKNSTGEKFCFVSNSHNSLDVEVDLQQDGKYYVPAWSVSILQDCKKEAFNTAKVNTQTTIIVRKPATEGNPLKWVWISDPMEDTLQGKGTFKASELLEQKGVTVDASDYFWYMTEVVINDTSSWKNATFHVTTTGHGLHAYVNGQYIGAQWGKYRLPSLRFGGLGKGHAWVNGQSIGRYWPTMVADENGCSDTCDYRGNYGPERCLSGCGETSQRFYHVPRLFLNNDTNTLILFEEMGGNPSNVSVQTITIGSICATADY
ncbi:Glycoside hydrolase, family 35 [Sesbania bispinosa]|nr:Glycoside hydrolase, family 35 [Sesbania bispinosa]